MHDRSRRFALLDFTEKELRVVALRTSGVRPEAIARMMNAKLDTTRWRLRMAMRKAGIDDIVMLTRWAMANGLDEVLEPERPQDVPAQPRKRPPRKRIKLNRSGRRAPRMENARVATLRKRERLMLGQGDAKGVQGSAKTIEIKMVKL